MGDHALWRWIALLCVTLLFVATTSHAGAEPNPPAPKSAPKNTPTLHLESPAKVTPAITPLPFSVAVKIEEKTKSKLEKWDKALTTLRDITVTVIFLVALMAFAVAAVRELIRKSIIIEPIDVPQSLVERGYTPEVIAERLAAEIRGFQRTARIRTREGEGYELSASQIDFTVPTAGVSYQSIIRYLRRSFGIPEQRIQGEITKETEASPAAVMGSPSESESLRITLRTHDGKSTSHPLASGSMKELPALLKEAAYEIVQLADPYLVADYWFRKEEAGTSKDRKFEKTLKSVHECLERTDAKDHHRAYLLWASALTLQRNFADAEKKFRIAARLAPRHPQIYNNWGITLRHQRRFDEAGAKYRKAIALDLRYIYAWGNSASVYNDRQMYRRASWCGRCAVWFGPRYASGWNSLGFALWRLGRTEEAVAAFQRAIDLDPKFGWSYLNWARLLREQRRYAEALGQARLAIEHASIPATAYTNLGDTLAVMRKYDDAETAYRQAIAADPGSADGFAGMCFLRRKQRRYPEAILEGEKGAAVDPLHASARIQLADALCDMQRFAEAIDRFDALLALNPYERWAYLGRERALEDQHRLEEAESDIERARKLEPRDSSIWTRWGFLLTAMHRYQAAVGKFQRAIDLDSANSTPRRGWGNILAKSGRFQEAIRQYELAVQANPTDGWVYLDWARLLRAQHHDEEAVDKLQLAADQGGLSAKAYAVWGDILVDQKKLPEAEETYQRAISADPLVADGSSGLAYLRQVQREYGKAIEAAEAAIKIDPFHKRARGVLIESLNRLNRSGEALQHLQAWHSANPFKVEVLIWWGNLLKNQGDEIGARKKFAEAIALDPWDPEPLRELGNFFHHQAKLGKSVLDQSVEQFDRATRLDPCDWLSWKGLGVVTHQDKQYARSEEAFQRGLTLRPFDANLHVAFAELLAELKSYLDAIAHCRKALTIEPGHRRAETLIESCQTALDKALS